MIFDGMVTLYRHFAADGALLYVGISASALFRLHQHKKDSHWFPEIAAIKLEHHPDRPAALAAEKVAIQTENPRYNVHWWVKPPPVKPPCKGCGSPLGKGRRFWCRQCAGVNDRLANLAWRERHPEKSREYGQAFRDRAKIAPVVGWPPITGQD